MQTIRIISTILILSLGFVFLFSFMASAQAPGDYPNKPIQLLVGWDPGGSADGRARGLAPKLGEVLGQPVVVVNKPGASGAVAMALLAKSKPDGYTLGDFGTSAVLFTPHLQKVEYNPLIDFTYICGTAIQPMGVVVRDDAPWKTIGELIDHIKKNPGQIKYGSYGIGSGGHLYMELFGRTAGFKWTHVPFKGDVPCITALLGGHIPVAVSASSFVPHARAGKLRILAMMTEDRWPTFPQVPSLKEFGFNFDYRAREVLGLCGPKGLPPEIVRRLESALKQAVESPEFQQMMEKLENVKKYRDSQEFTKLVHQSYHQVGQMIKELGFYQPGK